MAGDVGSPEQLRHVTELGPLDDDAGRGVDGDQHTAHLSRKGQLRDQLSGPVNREGLAQHARHQHREFVTAQTPNQLVVELALAQPPGHQGEQFVTGGVAEGVVDLTQAADIEQNQRDGGIAADLSQCRVAPRQQRRPVGQPRQRIVQRVVGAACGHRAQSSMGGRVVKRRRGCLGERGERVAIRLGQSTPSKQQPYLADLQPADCQPPRHDRPIWTRSPLWTMHLPASSTMVTSADPPSRSAE